MSKARTVVAVLGLVLAAYYVVLAAVAISVGY